MDGQVDDADRGDGCHVTAAGVPVADGVSVDRRLVVAPSVFLLVFVNALIECPDSCFPHPDSGLSALP